MNPEEIAKLSVLFSVVVLPALAVTARFALKPIVDAILRLKEGGVLSNNAVSGTDPMLLAEIRQMREEMAQLQQSVAQLQDVESFHRALAESGRQPSLGAGPDR
ncbi:MAG: hypothetical protein JO040_05330 [Gemmatimonadetes bacterium]|nr:hypothetical protein [Gemmatimonadota bacterium]